MNYDFTFSRGEAQLDFVALKQVLDGYGLTEEDFDEIVDFFRELIRLDRRQPEPPSFVPCLDLLLLLRRRLHFLKTEAQKDLRQHLERLERL